MLQLAAGRIGSDRRARGIALRAAGRRSALRATALVVLTTHLAGCFQYVPVSPGVAPNGAAVTVELNDQGRTAVTPLLGPSVRRVDGSVLASTDTSLVLSVTAVQYLNASGSWPFAGERVEVSHGQIAEVREQRLSRSRTVIAFAAAAAGLVAMTFITIAGFGGGDSPDRPGNGDPDPD